MTKSIQIVDMEHFKDIHRGEKVFMIGNGPSLTYDMLDKLQGHTTIAMNNIAISFSRTDWRPTYYMNVSRSFRGDKHWMDLGMEAINESGHSFLWVRNVLVPIMSGSKAPITLLSCATVPLWFEDKTACISRYGSSMQSALHIAQHMGFGQIFLLGCDLGYVNSIDTEGIEDFAHFDKNYLGSHRILLMSRENLIRDETRTYDAHVLAAMVLRQARIRVYICSEESPLTDIYEYVPFDEAIKSDY